MDCTPKHTLKSTEKISDLQLDGKRAGADNLALHVWLHPLTIPVIGASEFHAMLSSLPSFCSAKIEFEVVPYGVGIVLLNMGDQRPAIPLALGLP